MSDYIKREDAIREAVQAVDEWDGGYITSRDDMIEAYLNDIPAADVRENVQTKLRHRLRKRLVNTGKIKIDENGHPFQERVFCDEDIVYCSLCGKRQDGLWLKFCDYCGAKMKG